MADEIVLEAKARTVKGKQVLALRRQGFIPLALYGGHIEPSALQTDEKGLRAVLTKAGHNRLIRLNLEDGVPHIVIAREIQREPISGRLLHVDLQEISLTEKMTIEVPIVLKGTAPAVTRGEGLLIHLLEEVEIRVLPTDLIPEIIVDISVLNAVNQTLHVSDLQLGDKIEILTDADEPIAKIIPLKEEVITEEAPVATAEVEVIGKAKKEEEAAAEGKPEAKKAESK
ncbi:MAG: 50S ribosomal protein L25 [Anaerolineae bacterium]